MVEFKGDSLFGKVIHVDRFGNLVTNVPISQLRAFAGDADMSGMRVHVSDRTIDGISDHYGERPVGEVLALVGSSGLLEVAVREDSAARKLRVELGASVQIGR